MLKYFALMILVLTSFTAFSNGNNDESYIVKSKGYSGVISAKGDTLLPFIFTYLKRNNDYYISSVSSNDYSINGDSRNYCVFKRYDYKNPIYSFQTPIDLIFHENLIAGKLLSSDSIVIFNTLTQKEIKFVGDEVSSFNNDIFLISQNKKHGLINNDGKVIFENKYDEILNYSLENVNLRACIAFGGGRLRLSLSDSNLSWNEYKNRIIIKLGNKYALADINGNILTEIQYDYIGEYSESLLIVEENKKWGFIDVDGKTIIHTVYDKIGDYNENEFNRDILIFNWGASFYEQNILQYAKYKYSKGISEDGIIRVQKGKLQGFIDLEGKEIVKPVYKECSNFSQGLAAVKINKKWGYINNQGELIIPCIYENANGFVDSVAAVKYKKRWRLINKIGAMVNKFNCDSIQPFIAKNAIYKNKGKYGFINSSGVIFENCYDSISSFAKDIALAKRNGKWGYINKNAEPITEFSYDRSSPFLIKNNNIFNHNRIGKIEYFLDYSCKVLAFTDKGHFLDRINDTLFAVRNDCIYSQDCVDGLIDNNNNVILPFDFLRIDFNSDGLIQAEKWTGEILYYDKNLKLIWTSKRK